MKRTLGLTTLAVLLACGVANAQQINVKVGVLTDMSSLYADATGPGSVLAAKMAAADFMKDHPNVKVERPPEQTRHRNSTRQSMVRC
jgi:branched-chain amino acid transport system substrate-binding protein